MSVPGKVVGRRQYVRKFDHEEAQQRYRDGATLKELAEDYGVSSARIEQVVKPEVGKRAAERAANYRWTCPKCGSPTRGKGARCRSCFWEDISTSVRENELLCASCGEWKPDEDFSFNRGDRLLMRRQRRRKCRACDTKARQDYRARNYEREQEYWRLYNRKRRGG